MRCFNSHVKCRIASRRPDQSPTGLRRSGSMTLLRGRGHPVAITHAAICYADIRHSRRMIVALQETGRLMKAVDRMPVRLDDNALPPDCHPINRIASRVRKPAGFVRRIAGFANKVANPARKVANSVRGIADSARRVGDPAHEGGAFVRDSHNFAAKLYDHVENPVGYVLCDSGIRLAIPEAYSFYPIN